MKMKFRFAMLSATGLTLTMTACGALEDKINTKATACDSKVQPDASKKNPTSQEGLSDRLSARGIVKMSCVGDKMGDGRCDGGRHCH
jgi:hypothetical protein